MEEYNLRIDKERRKAVPKAFLVPDPNVLVYGSLVFLSESGSTPFERSVFQCW